MNSQIERMEYDCYRVTASYQGQEVQGISCFSPGTDISTKFAQDALRDCVTGPARAKFGGDVAFEIVNVEKGGGPIPLPEKF